MFFGLTGMPMRNSVLAKMVLARAEPEPLTVANFTTKSLMPLIYEFASFGGVRPLRLGSGPMGSDPISPGVHPDLPHSAQIGIVMRQTSL